MKKPRTLLLYGVADRGDLVAMFFASREDLNEFRASLPGRYKVMTLAGMDYEALKVKKIEQAAQVA